MHSGHSLRIRSFRVCLLIFITTSPERAYAQNMGQNIEKEKNFSATDHDTLDKSPVEETITIKGMQRPHAVPVAPIGQTTYSASRSAFKLTPSLSLADMAVTIPGVSFISGNGPRDTSLSIRGSNDRQSYGMRNIVVMEDGFPMTQPDGLARADLIDPHAYERLDVFQGPASTVYGNYALNGAVNLITRAGSDINGVHVGSDFGSFGFYNNYLTAGTSDKNYDIIFFGSDVRGNGFISNSNYETSTENLKMTFRVSLEDRLIFKAVNNITKTLLPLRLSLNQYEANPFQKGCLTLQAAGCASVNLYENGAYGPHTPLSAQLAGLGRFDRRTLIGMRWEHDFSSTLTWRNQFTYDERHISQPTSSLSYKGPYNSYNYSSDITSVDHIDNMILTSFGGAYFNYLDYGSKVYNLTPAGEASLGALAQTAYGHQWNAGARFQEALKINSQWQFVTGVGGEYSNLGATQAIYAYNASGHSITYVPAQRHYVNVAPEGAIIYTPLHDLILHTRIAAAYGTPTTSNLFVTPSGQYGNNTNLKSETSLGIDLGEDWHMGEQLRIQTTGFYEFHRNELITQSSGVNLPNYTYNAPSSQHRGIEIGVEVKPAPIDLSGLRLNASYTYDDQIYTNYTEILTNSTAHLQKTFDRSGNKIPGVIPHFLDARLMYDQPDGLLEGLGGMVELNWRSAYTLDNGNQLYAAGYKLINLNIHYIPPIESGALHNLYLFFNVQNLFNRTYIASASNISGSLTATGHQGNAALLADKAGSIYAGSPRAFYGGLQIKF